MLTGAKFNKFINYCQGNSIGGDSLYRINNKNVVDSFRFVLVSSREGGCHRKGCLMQTILVVDDQPHIRQLVEISLKKEGRRVLSVESGERAVEVALSDPPDLVIMDLMMPGGMDGFQAIEILRSYSATQGCRVLILTAKGKNIEPGLLEQAGAQGFLAKPFKLAVLLDQVEKLLAQ